MEEFQFLKFDYRSDCLTFTEHLISMERELSVLDLSISVADDFMSRGKLDELEKYIDKSWVSWGEERAWTFVLMTVNIIYYFSVHNLAIVNRRALHIYLSLARRD